MMLRPRAQLLDRGSIELVVCVNYEVKKSTARYQVSIALATTMEMEEKKSARRGKEELVLLF